MGDLKMVSCGSAARAVAGVEVCGDAHLVVGFPGGVLVAVIDGLGHGAEAAQAARAAAEAIAPIAAEPVSEIMKRCHAGLKRTRGAAVSLASFTAASMSWVAVGNVDAVAIRGATLQREHLLLRGGIVGHFLPPLRPAELALAPADTVIFFTDGIRPGFLGGLDLTGSPEALAQRILAAHARPEDDALVLVARYEGSAS